MTNDFLTNLLDHRPLPEVRRIPGLKLSGQAFADIVMVFEFLHNFGETLGFGKSTLFYTCQNKNHSSFYFELIIIVLFCRYGVATELEESSTRPSQ